MNISLLLEVLIDFLRANGQSLQNQKIAKDTRPYVITLDHSYRNDMFDLTSFAQEIRENIIAYMEGMSGLKSETLFAIKEIKLLCNIIYQRNIITFPNNDTQKVIQLLDLVAGMLGYNKTLMVEFTFPRKNIFEIKISKKKGILAKNDILDVVLRLVDFLKHLKNSLFERRYVYGEADRIIKYYYINQLSIVCCEFYRNYFNKFMPSHQSSFTFTPQGLNQNNEEIYCMQVNGADAIRTFFGTETPLLVYDYNLYLSLNDCFKGLSKGRLFDNYLFMHDLSRDDPKNLIGFLLCKLNLHSDQLIQKWKINAQETFLYSASSAMMLTLMQELKKNDLSSFYKAEINNLYKKLKLFLERYIQERNEHTVLNNIKNTETQKMGVVIQGAADVEAELPELVHLDQVGGSNKKFNTVQDELTAAFKRPAKSQDMNLSRVAEEKAKQVAPNNDKEKLDCVANDEFTLLASLRHGVLQKVEKSIDLLAQLKQLNSVNSQTPPLVTQQIERSNHSSVPTSHP